MRPIIWTIRLTSLLTLLLLSFPVVAGNSSVDCSRKSLATEIGKLDPASINTLEVFGNCVEDILIEGHANLTLIGAPGATITATTLHATVPLDIRSSRVTLDSLSVRDGTNNIYCNQNSFCVLRDVTSEVGNVGLLVQEQSTALVLGQSAFLNNSNTGIFLSGASSANVRPHFPNGFDPAEPGNVISGNGTGVFVQDGSFFRSDNSTISGNGDGILVRRGSVLKIFGIGNPDAVVSGNTNHGIVLQISASAQIRTPVTENGGFGVVIGPLSDTTTFGATIANNTSGDFLCTHHTSFDQQGGCPDQVADHSALLAGVFRGSDPQSGVDTLTFSGMNVQIVNGQGATDSQDSTGNLIIGYNEARNDGSDDRSGSHNLVLGRGNNFTQYGGVVSGEVNANDAPFSWIVGGLGNQTQSVAGFAPNCCNPTSGMAIIGGADNRADGWNSVIVGGDTSETTGGAAKSVVLAGRENSTQFGNSFIGGGRNNITGSFLSAILGGRDNITGDFTTAHQTTTVVGGRNNTVHGFYSSVIGGRFNDASGDFSLVAGGLGGSAPGAFDNPDQHTP